MACVKLSKKESVRYVADKEYREQVNNTVLTLAGDLGGWGINVEDWEGNSLQWLLGEEHSYSGD